MGEKAQLISDAFQVFLKESPKHAQAWMDAVRGLSEASALDARTKALAYIDVVSRELKLMDLTGNVNPDEVLSPERRRRYAFEGDLLTLSSFDDRGTVTAITTWRRLK